jgi:hypothetical protein
MSVNWAGATSRLDRINASDPMALAEVLAAVAVVNSDLETAPSARHPRDSLDTLPTSRADLPRKLSEWLDKLIDKLKEIVKAVGAESFTVTVGSQVSVSVTFRAPAPANEGSRRSDQHRRPLA